MSFDGDLSNAFFTSDVLSDDFFPNIIAKQLKVSRNTFKVRLVMFTSATGKSDNFVSEVYRVKVKIEHCEIGKLEVLDVIIKASFATLPQLKKMSVFPREQLMYEDVIPSLEAVWSERAGEKVEFAPRCYHVESDPYEIIVLEDLKPRGYEMKDKRCGLDLAQTKLALAKLAKFHAASVVRYGQNELVSPCLDKMTQYTEHPPGTPAFNSFNCLYQKFLSTVRELKMSDAIVDKIARWDLQEFMKGFYMAATPLKCGFRVLNHGDTWLNNVLMRGEDEDALFVDFQLSYWGTPNGDLIYLLFSSVDDEAKIQHFDEILNYFYEELRQSLKKLKYTGYTPSVQELREDFLERKIFVNSLFLTVIPITRNTSGKNFEIMEFFKGNPSDDKLNALFGNDTFKNLTRTWLPFMDKLGLLDLQGS